MLAFYGARNQQPAAVTDASDPMAVGSNGHVFHIEDLMQAIRADREPYVTVQSAAHAVEIVSAIYESGRSGREVRIG